MSVYLKINEIKGSVPVRGYEGTIDIHHYHVVSSRSINEKSGIIQNRTAGLVKWSSLVLTKSVDKSSTGLLQHFYSAKVIPEMTLIHLSTGAVPERYLTNTFYNVLISRFEESNHSDGVLETVEMSFSRYEKRNMPLNEAMRATTPQTVGYDVEQAVLI